MEINGKKLRITKASFSEAMALQRAVASSLEGKHFPKGMDDNVDEIIHAVLSAATSSEVEEALFTCARRAMVGEEKITRDFFEDSERWEHYYPIMFEIMKENLYPFFKRIFSGSSVLSQKIADILKSK